MTTRVNIGDGTITIAEILEGRGPGDDVLLERDGDVVAQVTFRVQPAVAETDRILPLRFGLWRGKGWISDDFDAPLPPDEQALWERELPKAR